MWKRLLLGIWELDHLVRLHQLGFIAVWPLLGFAAVADWSVKSVAGLLLVSLFFNAYGVLLDDAVHLDVDRRDPLRADRWLVRGTLSVRQALVLALLQLPLMLGAHLAAGFPNAALLSLIGVVIGQGVYHLYGKRFPIPPVMEAAEAAAAFLLVVYGATVTGTALTPLVWLTAGTGAAFILLVNGFHGSLRDIEVEIGLQQRTTPIWLGCRGVEAGHVHISRAMSVYAGACQLGLIALSVAVAIELNPQGDRSVAPLLLALGASLGHGVLFILLHTVPKPAWDVLMRLHVAILVLPIMLAFVPRLGAARSAVLGLVYFGPALLTALWWFRRVRSRVVIGSRAAMALAGAKSPLLDSDGQR